MRRRRSRSAAHACVYERGESHMKEQLIPEIVTDRALTLLPPVITAERAEHVSRRRQTALRRTPEVVFVFFLLLYSKRHRNEQNNRAPP